MFRSLHSARRLDHDFAFHNGIGIDPKYGVQILGLSGFTRANNTPEADRTGYLPAARTEYGGPHLAGEFRSG